MGERRRLLEARLAEMTAKWEEVAGGFDAGWAECSRFSAGLEARLAEVEAERDAAKSAWECAEAEVATLRERAQKDDEEARDAAAWRREMRAALAASEARARYLAAELEASRGRSLPRVTSEREES